MVLSNLLAFVTAGALSIAVAYVIERLRWPRWANWALSIACFAGAVSIVLLLGSSIADSPWPAAISLGLTTIAGATAGLGLHGGRFAQVNR